MEKGIEFGFEHYMEQIPEMGTVDPRASSPLVLAYIGDCVFDLIKIGRASCRERV